MSVIEVQELCKSYGPTRAVDRLSFTVRPGVVTGFLGPNGAGKSTTMRLILGLDRPTSGSATVGGRPFVTARRPLTTAGALLDATALHPSRTAFRHLQALALSNDIPLARIDEVLAEVGLGNVARHRIKTFSLGMRQRLGIAAALLGDPAVLILDEPSNGLDPEGIIWLRGMLRQFADRGRTVLVSSHLMGETANYADHLLVLGHGRLLADAPLPEVVGRYAHNAVRLRVADDARLRETLAAASLTAAPDDAGGWVIENAQSDDVGRILAAASIPVLRLSQDVGSLESAYLALTAHQTDFAATADNSPAHNPGEESAS